MNLRGLTLVVLAAAGIGCSEEDPAAVPPPITPAAPAGPVEAPLPPRVVPEAEAEAVVAATLRGLGLLERFDNGAAAAAFGEALERVPGFYPAVLGRGVALANLREDPDGAEAALRLAVRLEPDDPRAWFLLGLLHARGLAVPRPADAEPCFRRVVDLAPDDADGHLRLGMALMDLGRTDEAGAALDRALALNPSLGPALYQRGTLLRNAGRTEEAVAVLRRYQALEQSKKVDFREDVYGYQGPLGEMPREWGAWLPEGKGGPGVASQGLTGWDEEIDPFDGEVPGTDAAMLVTDLDGDGLPDLVHAGTRCWYPGGRSSFGKPRPLPLAAAGALAASDLDHDGRTDLVAAGTGVVYDASGAEPRVVSLDADDTDGARFVVDVDGDGWLDIVGGSRVWLSVEGRTWTRIAGALPEGFAVNLVVDADGDRWPDLADTTARKVAHNVREGRFGEPEPFDWPAMLPPGTAVGDIHADGTAQVLVSRGSRAWLLPGSGSSTAQVEWEVQETTTGSVPKPADVVGQVLFDREGDGDLDILLVTRAAFHVLINPLDAAAHTITLRLQGIHSPNGRKHGLCNAPGIGTRVDVHVGRTHRRFRFGLDPVPAGPVRGPTDVVVLGLGDAKQADLISLRWTEGLVQSELEVKPGPTRIEELQRKASW